MKGSEAFLQTLRSAGVKHIFGNPGTTEVGLLNALKDFPDIQYIMTLHESVAAGMADGYARSCRSPGVVSVHTAVGTANTLGMAINAFADYSPLLIMAGLKDSRSLGGGIFCDTPFHAGDLLRQYTKWTWQCLEPENISRDTAMALHHALAAPCGPVFLAIPENFWEESVHKEIHPLSTVSRFQQAASQEHINDAARLIGEAFRPFILAGNEAGAEGVMELVIRLAEERRIPVFSEERINWSYASFPNDHALYCGPYNPRSEPVSAADLCIGIGSKMFMPMAYSPLPHLSPGTKLIHLHPDLRQIGSLYPAHVGLAGSVGKNLELLLAALSKRHPPPQEENWRSLWEQYRKNRIGQLAAIRSKASAKGKYPDIFDLAEKLSHAALPNAIVVNEAIRSGHILPDYFTFSSTRSYYGYTGGCLGWGVPAAMGIKLAHPKRQVIAFIGDGSFLFSCQALWTASRYGLKIKIILCNNGGYMAVKSSLREYHENPAGRNNLVGEISRASVDFLSLARGFGIPALRVETPAELAAKLQEALSADGSFLLEVMLEHEALETRHL